MTLVMVAGLYFSTWPTSISLEKIDSPAFKIYGMAIAEFSIWKKSGIIRFL